ncbi:MAG: hypothetical protein HKM24_00250 [Gammaproteobacteria bacterium]|nr:hypothetical protein [Gammaproteobacteria bacterium]
MVSSCGFQLRSQASWPVQWSPVWVADDVSGTDLSYDLRAELRAAGAVLADTAEQAMSTIDLTHDEVGRRVLSVSRQGGPEEYELYQLVKFSFSVNQPQPNSFPEQRIVVTRDYDYDKNDILVTERDAERLQVALSDELAQRIVTQVAHFHRRSVAIDTAKTDVSPDVVQP